MEIKCPCTIRTSHNYSSFDFRHGNSIQSHGALSLDKVNFPGLLITSITIDKVSGEGNENDFVIEISLPEPIDNQQIKILLSSITQQISFLINLSEQAVNPHHGTFYVDMDLFNIKIENTGGPLDWQFKMGMHSSVAFDFSSISLKSTNHQLLMELFYEGTRAELPKSKYFHWFLILEHLEYSDEYKKQFRQAEHIFSEQEQQRIKNTADKCKSERKRNLILGILQPKYTLENREDKLYEFITNTLNISSFSVGLKTEEIDKQTISAIVKTRHSLFHPGESLNENILWFKLYPLVVEILKKII